MRERPEPITAASRPSKRFVMIGAMPSWTSATPLPPLRGDLDIVPTEQEGRSLFLLRDAESDDDRALGLSPGGMAVAAMLDGRRSAEDLARDLARENGAEIPAADILSLAVQLEASGLLDTPESLAARRARLDAFLKSSSRPAMFSGPGGYPDKPEKLEPYLARFFEAPKGPGRRASSAGEAAAKGLVAPHIDLHRGGPAYACAYGALAGTEPPDVIVALGVAHVSPNSPWVFTRKSYETPYGAMPVDPELYEEMTRPLWYDPLADEWTHRREHSLEFQALWLRYLWKDKTPPWVPILCSTFERFSATQAPSSTPTVEEALRKIGSVLAGRSKTQRVLVLAGIDLAHVGPRFGDQVQLTPELERKIETEDRASLEKALALDADGFYLSVVKDEHWRHVCGLSALYTALRWLKDASGGRAQGELLTYGQAADPMGGIVSFTGAIYR